MPQTQFINTTMLDPGGYAAQLEQARAERLAQMLQDQAIQPVLPAPNGGVAPAPISWTQGLAKLMQAYVANKAGQRSDALERGIINRQSDMFNQLLGTGGSAAPGMQGAPGAPNPAMDQVNQAAGASAWAPESLGGNAGTVQALSSMLAPQPTGARGGSLPSLTGDVGRDRLMASQMGLQKYIEQLGKRYDWTDQQKNDVYRNISPQESRGMAIAEALRGSVVPGSSATMALDAQGQPVANAVPGLAQNMSQLTGLNKAQETINAPPGMIGTQAGGSYFGYPTDVAGPPPALRAPSTGAAPTAATPPTQRPAAAAAVAGATAPPAAPEWLKDAPDLPRPRGIGMPDIDTKTRLEQAGAERGALAKELGGNAVDADLRLRQGFDVAAQLQRASVGPASEFLNAARAYGVQMGIISPEAAEKYTKSTELNKYLIQSALEQGRKLFGSRFTQSEVGVMLNQAAPSGTMSAPVIRALTLESMAKASYEKQMATDFRAYDAAGKDPMWFKSHYPIAKPMDTYAEQVMPQLAAEFDKRAAQGAQQLPQRPGQPPAGGPAKVQSEADWAALPSGATYIAPDGSQRTKR
jgi:hypothetical protein